MLSRRIDIFRILAVAAFLLPAGPAEQTMGVSIDVRPDDPPPTIVAPRSGGMLPVGLLTGDGFDALTAAPATLRLGPTGAEAVPVRVNRIDVDGDGDTDLQLFFAVQETGVQCETTFLILRGRTTEGQEFEGSEPIVTEGCVAPTPAIP